MSLIKRIVVATDFSEQSARALAYADKLATRFGAALHLIHVVQDPFQQPWVVEAYSVNLPELKQEWVRGATIELERWAAKYAGRPAPVCRVGHPAWEIVAYANEIDADLIIVGSHGRGVIGRALLGSVAERVVREATCPVLTIREPRGLTHTIEEETAAADPILVTR